MSINPTHSAQVRVITGNAAAAIGATLCRPDVIAAYPITPQTEVVEKLSEFHAQGILDAEMITVEGENSAMSAVTAASVAGGRVFTATSSWGLVFMYDAVMVAAGNRSPVVMANVNREPPGIMAVSSGQQDMINTRDCGWIFLIAEDSQEILDMIIMAYRLAEDHDIQLPVMVHYDGFYLSYMAERVEIPTNRDVDEYLSVLKAQPQRPRLIPGKPLELVLTVYSRGFLSFDTSIAWPWTGPSKSSIRLLWTLIADSGAPTTGRWKPIAAMTPISFWSAPEACAARSKR